MRGGKSKGLGARGEERGAGREGSGVRGTGGEVRRSSSLPRSGGREKGLLGPVIFTLFFLTACGPTTVYEQSSTLPPVGWSYADSLAFEYTVTDLDQRYDLVLDVTHGHDFPYQNFYVQLRTELPDGSSKEEELSLQLANNFGAFAGDCGGDGCTYSAGLLSATRFTEAGLHRWVVRQFSRDNPLREVRGVGFRIIESEVVTSE